MMQRKYVVTSRLAPHLGSDLPKIEMIERYSFGPFDAAKTYAKTLMPGYTVIPGGRLLGNIIKFEAINYDIGYGADILVHEC